jgi:hypothetical protein
MVSEDAPRAAGSKQPGEVPKESQSWWKRFGEWITLVIAIFTAAGLILNQGSTQGDEIRELRNQVGDLRVEVTKLQEADKNSNERITRLSNSLMRWTGDEFSDICAVLGGKYVPAEQYCALKEGILKYHPLHLE